MISVLKYMRVRASPFASCTVPHARCSHGSRSGVVRISFCSHSESIWKENNKAVQGQCPCLYPISNSPDDIYPQNLLGHMIIISMFFFLYIFNENTSGLKPHPLNHTVTCSWCYPLSITYIVQSRISYSQMQFNL